MNREKFPTEVGGDYVSELKVMRSGAGYYIGRSYWDTEFGFEGPFSRESGYFGTEEQAQRELDEQSFEVRGCLENDWAYANGLPRPGEES